MSKRTQEEINELVRKRKDEIILKSVTLGKFVAEYTTDEFHAAYILLTHCTCFCNECSWHKENLAKIDKEINKAASIYFTVKSLLESDKLIIKDNDTPTLIDLHYLKELLGIEN
jgi:hypothetical protein